MARTLMFGYQWSDGTFRAEPEPKPQVVVQYTPKGRREWVKRGFFKRDKPMSRREVTLKASNARLWLETMLSRGPLLARLVLLQAKLEGFSEPGLRRAKRRLGIKSKRRGGKGTGRRNPWIWQLPKAESE